MWCVGLVLLALTVRMQPFGISQSNRIRAMLDVGVSAAAAKTKKRNEATRARRLLAGLVDLHVPDRGSRSCRQRSCARARSYAHVSLHVLGLSRKAGLSL